MIEEGVLDGLLDPVIILDGNRVAFANAAARSLFGALAQAEDVRLALRQPEALALLSKDVNGQVEFAGPGGPEQRLEMRLRHGDGHRVVQIVDRSARHLADRLRTDFVANASHELRTPLASVRGFVETLLEDEIDAETRRRFLEIIRAEAHRMDRLVSDLLSLSRIEADRFVLPDLDVALAPLVADVVAESGPPAEARVQGEPVIRGDRAQLSQLLHNLIDNARRYGDEGKPVKVRLASNATMAVLSVTDEGPGIAPEHLPRLTERFYRADTVRSQALGGTGLGLAIVKHIVERHRGRLDIRSRVGKGSVVTVELPLVTQPSRG